MMTVRRFIYFVRSHLTTKVLAWVFIFSAMGVISFYLLQFFPNFSVFMIVQCVDANQMALTTITPNPIEVIEMRFMPGSDAISMASISDSSTVYEPTPEPSLLEEEGVIQENVQPRTNFYYVCPTVALYVGAGLAVLSWTAFILHMLGVG